MKTWQSILLGVFLGIIFTGIIVIIANQPRGEPIQLSPSASPSPAKVYITGAINLPGVYSLSASSRVQELVDLAGGFTTDADKSGVNLAAVVMDGQKIVVPYIKSETPSNNIKTPATTQAAFPININTASKEELDALPGIGSLKAEDIVKYREQKGLFNTIDDIQNVPGIGSGIFSKIKDLITVN